MGVQENQCPGYILALIILGLLIGPVFHLSSPERMAELAPIFAPIALMVLLFDGGLRMSIPKVVYDTPKASLFALMNVLLSMLVSSIFMNFAFGWDYALGAILGAIVGGTSSAIVIPILSKFNHGEECKGILALESVITDVLCIIISITIMDLLLQSSANPINTIMGTFSIGIILGVLFGVLWLSLINKFKGLSYMLTLAIIFVLYSLAEWSGGSGAIAALVFGLALGNREDFCNFFHIGASCDTDKENLRVMQSEVSFFVKTFFFVYLGMVFSVKGFFPIIAGAVLSMLLIASRYFSTRVIAVDGQLKKQVNFMVAMAPRGLAAAVLAQVPLTRGLVSDSSITEIVFVVIVTTVVLSSIGIAYLGNKDNKDEEDRKKEESTNKLKGIINEAKSPGATSQH
ncbi:MAG: cation:proton antiporter [Candidatus Micrarchaeota archaeon]